MQLRKVTAEAENKKSLQATTQTATQRGKKKLKLDGAATNTSSSSSNVHDVGIGEEEEEDDEESLTHKSVAPIRDSLTTLPIVPLKLDPPHPHTEGSLQRISHPLGTTLSVEEIIPLNGAIRTSTMIVTGAKGGKANSGNNKNNNNINAGNTATNTTTTTVYQNIVNASGLERKSLQQQRDDEMERLNLLTHHVDYFQQLKAWFRIGYRYRQMRYRDRLASLGVTSLAVERSYAAATLAAAAAAAAATGATSINTTVPQMSNEIGTASPRAASVFLPDAHGGGGEGTSSSNAVVVDNEGRRGAALGASGVSIIRTPGGVAHTASRVRENPGGGGDASALNSVSTPGLASAQAARSLAGFAALLAGPSSISTSNNHHNSGVGQHGTEWNNFRPTVMVGLASPLPPRRILATSGMGGGSGGGGGGSASAKEATSNSWGNGSGMDNNGSEENESGGNHWGKLFVGAAVGGGGGGGNDRNNNNHNHNHNQTTSNTALGASPTMSTGYSPTTGEGVGGGNSSSVAPSPVPIAQVAAFLTAFADARSSP